MWADRSTVFVKVVYGGFHDAKIGMRLFGSQSEEVILDKPQKFHVSFLYFAYVKLFKLFSIVLL